MLSPERSIEIQADLLGADISMQLDECTDFPVSYDKAAQSMELSLRWGKRSLEAFGDRENQTLFRNRAGIKFPRAPQSSPPKRSVRRRHAGGYGGFAIGGLAVGEGHAAMCETLSVTTPHLPKDRPRYLMGVGKPIDIVEAVYRGVDMFDCVIPTRSGRHGQVWTDTGPYNIKRAEFAEDQSPLDPEISCPGVARLHESLCSSFDTVERVAGRHDPVLAQHRLFRRFDVANTGVHRCRDIETFRHGISRELVEANNMRLGCFTG